LQLALLRLRNEMPFELNQLPRNHRNARPRLLYVSGFVLHSWLVSNSKERMARLFFLVLSLGGAPAKPVGSDLPVY
jgi:hypothetical protein